MVHSSKRDRRPATSALRRTTALTAMVFALLLIVPLVAFAQEHPEHPTKHEAEHPEKKAAPTMSMDALSSAIKGYVKQDAALKNGYFVIYDKVDEKPLALTLDKVHEDKLASLGDGVYFACTDMKATDGTMYDLDFMMKKTDSGIEPTEVSIHKKAGTPRYSWKESNGLWKKVSSK